MFEEVIKSTRHPENGNIIYSGRQCFLFLVGHISLERRTPLGWCTQLT